MAHASIEQFGGSLRAWTRSGDEAQTIVVNIAKLPDFFSQSPT